MQIAWILRWPNNCTMRSSNTDRIPFQKRPKLRIALTGTATFAFVSTWNTSPFQLNQHIFASILRSYLEPSKPHPFLIILTSSAFCTKNLFNLPNPLANYWALQSLLTDIKRVKGQPPAQKLPIIPDVLKKNYLPLNLRTSFDASFWAVCLVSFYGMLHKHHLLAGSCHTFEPSQQLVWSDFQIFPWGALVTIRWSKTIQFRERVVQIPLPLIPDSPLCPVIAIQRAFSFVPNVRPPQLPRNQKRAKMEIRPRMSLIVIVKPQSQDFLALNLAV